MKTIIFTFFCLLIAVPLSSKQTVENDVCNPVSDKGAVYEGNITGLSTFYGMTSQGLEAAGYYINLDNYPDMNFEITLKNGIKWGFIDEIAPGLAIVHSEKCKGWTVRLTVNSKMKVTKCKILSYGEEN